MRTLTTLLALAVSLFACTAAEETDSSGAAISQGAIEAHTLDDGKRLVISSTDAAGKKTETELRASDFTAELPATDPKTGASTTNVFSGIHFVEALAGSKDPGG